LPITLVNRIIQFLKFLALPYMETQDHSFDISVITPTFNEAQNIPLLYKALEETLKDYSWELIVVDDDSQDKTWHIGRELAQQHPNISVLRRVRSRGLSSACIEGVQLASGKYTVVMDADLQHDETIIPSMIEKLNNQAELVIGSRFAENASASGLSSQKRELMSRVGNSISSFLMRHKLTDPLTGFFALRTEQFMQLSPKLSNSGFKILVDLLMVGQFKLVEEVGFQFRKRVAGESKLDHVIIWQFATFLIEKLSRGLLPARFISFAAVGGSGVFVHFATLFAVMSFTQTFWIGQLVATVVAMTSNFFINNWLTFYDKRLSGLQLLRGLGLFAAIGSIGIIANVGFASYLADQLAGQFDHINTAIILAATAGILIDTIWKYVMSVRFVWLRK